MALVELEGLVVDIDGRRILDGVSFSFDGGVLVLLGPNGAGKTTLMKTLVGLVKPSGGRCLLLGRECFERRLGGFDDVVLAFSEPPLLGDTVSSIYDELCGLRRCDWDLFRSYVARLGLDPGRVVGARFTSLSSGERMKTYLAMVLSLDARLYLLDEPNANLDAASRPLLGELLGEVSGRASLVVSTHIYEFIDELASHVAILKGGRLLLFGEKAELEEGLRDTCILRVRRGCDVESLGVEVAARLAGGALLVRGCSGILRSLDAHCILSASRASLLALYMEVVGGDGAGVAGF